LFQLWVVHERIGVFGGMRIGREIEVLEENLTNASSPAANAIRTDLGMTLRSRRLTA
jgi:hypothetical protein